MNRINEIFKEARACIDYINAPHPIDAKVEGELITAFMLGAKWADENPTKAYTGLDKSRPISLGNYMTIGNYIILLSDHEGKAPRGKSHKVNENWYYDYEAATSIQFPDGFRLPTTYEWLNICKLLDNNADEIQSKLKLELNGYYNMESVYCFGSRGYYWSSTYYDIIRAYLLYFGSRYVDPQNYSSRDYGYTVRGIKLITE